LRYVILAALSVFILIGMGAAGTTTASNVTFNFEQSVDGEGYFMTYKYVKMGSTEDTIGSVSAKDYKHGSGTIDSEVVLTAETVDYRYFGGGQNITDIFGCISMIEDISMVYVPETIAYGTGYYARNPITYESLLKEKTDIKNYGAASSMRHEIEYASAIDKDLEILVKNSWYNETDPVQRNLGTTWMKVTETVTDGKTHIGVLQGDPALGNEHTSGSAASASAWRDPLIEVDEDYVGTFTISKNMTLEVPYDRVITSAGWLSCCFGGLEDVNPKDYKWLESGIADCTCFVAPTTAEF
jgi:hypothetical protein